MEQLKDPTRAYVLFLAGALLVCREFVAPGRVLPGALGAILLAWALYGLLIWPWSWYGSSSIALAAILAILYAASGSRWLPYMAAFAFATGSTLLIVVSPGIHPVAAVFGGAVMFLACWLLRCAYLARANKRRT